MLTIRQEREKRTKLDLRQTNRLVMRGALILFIFMILSGCALDSSNELMESTEISFAIPIAPEFQSFYENNGGVRILGQPLTDAYVELGGELTIQYFRGMRLEYDVEQDQVFITPLGQWSMPDEEDQLPAPISFDEPEPFDSSEVIAVQDEFLNFYELYGGETLFGKAITGELDEGGTRVQYFENARLEWHPGETIGNRVQVGPLGEEHYLQFGVFKNPGRSRPLDSAAVREAVISSHFRSPILYAGQEQVLFVDVNTADGQQPVSDVPVEITISYNGISEVVSLPATDGTGQTQSVLDMKDLEPGQKVLVTVKANNAAGESIGTITNSFMTWW